MRLWIDDARPAPIGWHWAKTSQQALTVLKIKLGWITHVSFDHDLGGNDTTRPVALWLEEHAYIPGHPSAGVFAIHTTVHSANPVGRKWLEASLRKSTMLQDVPLA